jgi:hypothetical protein
MKLETSNCVHCNKERVVETLTKVCIECAYSIISCIRHFEQNVKAAPILEAGRGKWCFNMEVSVGECYTVAFTPLKYWEEEDSFCEVHHLSEEDQEYLYYATGDDMALCDEVNYELNIDSDEARKKFLELGMIELNLD